MRKDRIIRQFKLLRDYGEGVENMNFEQFIEKVKAEIKELIGDGYSVTVNGVVKINRELQGITIKNKEFGVYPSIYLEDYYEEFEKGKSIKKIAEEIVEASKQERIDVNSIVEYLQDYEWVKPRLRVKLINYTRNEKLLLTIPHERILDLAVIPYIVLIKDKDIMTTKVQYPLLAQWDINSDDLMRQAEANTILSEPTVVEEMKDFIHKMLRKDFADIFPDSNDADKEEIISVLLRDDRFATEMYILTNEKKIDGAYGAFQTKELSALADRIEVDSLFILPSSRHELIAVPSKHMQPDKLREMVESVNCTEVPEEDFLSNTVYKYDRLTNQISIED